MSASRKQKAIVKVQMGSAGTPPKVVKHVSTESPAAAPKPARNVPKVQMGSAGAPAKIMKHVPQR